MKYKTYLIATAVFVSIFILLNSLIHIPIISDMIINSEKNTNIKILKLFSLFLLIYCFVSLARFEKKITISLTLVAILLLEFVILKNYQIPIIKNITKADQKLGWVWIPNSSKVNVFVDKNITLRFNSKGLRGSEKSLKNKILILGNSIVQAQHIDENKTFSYLTNAINGGFDGYDTYMERDRLKRDLLTLEADKLILVVNTVDIHSLEQSRQIIKQTLASNHSIEKKSLLEDYTLKIKLIDFFSHPPLEKEDMNQKDTWYLNKHKNEIANDIWDEWTDTILDIKKSFNGQFYIVLTPPRGILKEYKTDKQQYSLNKKLDSFSQSHNIVFIDLLPYLAEYNENLYLDPVHFNEKGHSIIATTLKSLL